MKSQIVSKLAVPSALAFTAKSAILYHEDTAAKIFSDVAITVQVSQSKRYTEQIRKLSSLHHLLLLSHPLFGVRNR